jgi:putative DNA primase/helicase
MAGTAVNGWLYFEAVSVIGLFPARASLLVVIGMAVGMLGFPAGAWTSERLGRVPRAPTAISGSHEPCRYHLFFQHPPLATKAKATPWHPKLEFRGNRGIVVIAPSLHKSGNRYEWADGQSLDDLPLPIVPKRVLAALEKAITPPPTPPSFKKPTRVTAKEISASRSTLEFLSGKYAAGPNWNDKLFAAACDLKGRGVPAERAEQMLLDGAQPWNEAEADNALRTIRSAFSQPRRPAKS